MPSTSTKTASPLWVIIAFATVYLVWGSTYFFIRFAMQGGFPPFFLGAVRFIIAGLIMMTWCVIKKEKIFNKKDIITASITGILLLFVANGIVIWSEQTLPSAMVAILVSSAPIWFVVLDKPHWSVNFRSTATIIGLIIGFGGVILLFSEQIGNIFKSADAQAKLPWMLLLVVGTISWSGGSIYSKNRKSTSSTTVSSAWQMLAAGLVYVPVSFLHGEYKGLHLQNIQPHGWMGLIYLIIFGSIAGFSAYVWLLQVRPATQVSTYAYVNPVIAVILGIFFGGEHISLTQIGGLAVILLSVLLINLSKYRKEKKAVELVNG
ncbi:EamA family transporter [Mucilaginibacter gotjawali]|uniref:Drug/metabolite transporter (DMT)-like permease n=2 Tax=Mucilaginibacter gotjawali TaxID=1550579 RepID=A0A839SFX3_9SPHI|nr:EamA family transporter [Mucilaginibacter gotjawali]MBB3056222.1 drug/metabolite transporter (DMT)-like permease [Mucilaginibacter gotjawali]BAU53435.1 putative inner membrane transporter YedA [Mucilaginibacter gotjawali]